MTSRPALAGYWAGRSKRLVAVRVVVSLACFGLALGRADPAAAADPVLAAAGDIACAPGSTPTPSTCQQMATPTSCLLQRPQQLRCLATRAQNYPSGTLAQYMGTGAFNDTWGRAKSIIHPSPGNHEYDVSATAAGYFSYFGAAAGPAGQGYYSYDLGAWHIISLNSNCSDSNI